MATRRKPRSTAETGGARGLLVRPHDEALDVDGVQIARLRRACLAWPQVNERLGHGSPCFYADQKIFAMFSDNHHGDGRLAVWLRAPPGAQEMLLETSPDEIFRPPYVGAYGWIGAHLRRCDDAALTHLVGSAYRAAASKKLLAQLKD
jgi:hypothetical protein